MSGFYFLACLCSLGGVQARRGAATSFEQKLSLRHRKHISTKNQEKTLQRKEKFVACYVSKKTGKFVSSLTSAIPLMYLNGMKISAVLNIKG